MIRVGFIGAVSKEWMGGLNYFKNLLYAVHTLEDRQIEPIVFVGVKTDKWIKEMFRPYAEVIEHPIFDRKSLPWYLWKILARLSGSNFVLEKVLQKYNIQVLSHSGLAGFKSCKVVSWIPDFQHLHLPVMFSTNEIEKRDTDYLNLAQKSDAIVLSSYDAWKDFSQFAPDFINKAKVLQFVSQPDPHYNDLNIDDEKHVRKIYGIETPFFYLPNQFWAHKNHQIVFEAIKILKDRGHDVYIVCTGYMNDYRNTKHIAELKNYIEVNNIHKNIRLLGIVPYEDVFALMKFSVAVINPSLFEGWSSTVEECKSIGKNMILSDLEVHKEQWPNAAFFEKGNAIDLANILIKYESDEDLFLHNTQNLKVRTENFGRTFETVIIDVNNHHD